MNRAFVLLAGCSLIQCRTDVSLGLLDPGETVTPSVAPTCPSTAATLVTAIDPSFGQLRAIAARGDRVVAAFARPDGAGLVASAPASGGALTELARVGADPVSIAFDGTYAYVACQASAAVHRVRSGEASVATLQSAVSSVAVDARGNATWTRPSDDAVVSWSFAGGAPSVVAIVPRAQSVLERDGVRYISGDQALYALRPNDAAPVKLASACGPGALAFDGDALFCIDDGTLRRIDASTGASVAIAGGIRGARDVVVARGRAFFRAEGPSGGSIMAIPVDGLGGPTLVEVIGPGPAAIATDGCGLYYAAGSFLIRRAL